MADTVIAAESIPAGTQRRTLPWSPALVVLGLLWLFAVRQLQFEWSINPQYTYGWTMPFLVGYLFFERWKCRPAADAPVLLHGIGLGVALLALTLLPIRLIGESAPDWRLLGWAMGGVCVAITLATVYFAGGRNWLLHFAFPVVFFLVAVPSQAPFEQSLVQWLMRSVTQICVEALSWAGIPAIQSGNVIQISTGKVGVEEACSGVRSLQTTLMISLFMGELLRFGMIRRVILLAGGLFVAFLCNAGRAFFLVWVSAKSGTDEVAKWHDNVGLAVLLSSLAGVGILCAILNPGKKPAPETATDADEQPPAQPLSVPRNPPPSWVLIGLAAWLVAVEIGTEVWYRSAETNKPRAEAWKVAWPENAKGFREVEITDVTRNILKYHRSAFRCVDRRCGTPLGDGFSPMGSRSYFGPACTFAWSGGLPPVRWCSDDGGSRSPSDAHQRSGASHALVCLPRAGRGDLCFLLSLGATARGK